MRRKGCGKQSSVAHLRRAIVSCRLVVPHVHARGVSHLTHLRCVRLRAAMLHLRCVQRVRVCRIGDAKDVEPHARRGVYAVDHAVRARRRRAGRGWETVVCRASPMRCCVVLSRRPPRACTWGFPPYASPMRPSSCGIFVRHFRIGDAEGVEPHARRGV